MCNVSPTEFRKRVSGSTARLHGFAQRTAADLFFRRHFRIASERPVISFSFDDFPRSALLAGGAILRRFGLRGTYYASFGLMGATSPTGRMFTFDDVRAVLQQGHEIGCHTYDHCDSWHTPSTVFNRSIVANRMAFTKAVSTGHLKSFSYPIRPPRPSTKRVAARHFACSRGGGQTFNAGEVDLNYLRACFLEQTREDGRIIQSLIDRNHDARGWLIFATHDVDRDHTPFGCTAEFFEFVVQCAVNSRALILPIAEALEALQQPAKEARGRPAQHQMT
jgi:hypothetical protein